MGLTGALLTAALLLTGCSSGDDPGSDAAGARGAPATPQATPAAAGVTPLGSPAPSSLAAPSATRSGIGVPTSSRPGKTGQGKNSPGTTTPNDAPGGRPASGSRWRPRPGLTWQWQLTGTIDTTVQAAVYDVDLFTTSAATVAALHRQGRKVICYVSVGAWEDFRPDQARFPASVLGASNGWEGERWLDIRRTDILLPILADRFDLCRKKGFDAVEPDNVDGYDNDTGFPLTAADQLKFNRALATLAHERGLAIGLKNDLEQIPSLVGSFDFAVNEQCAEYDECDALTPFVRAGKAVFHAEYNRTPAQFCATSSALKLSSLRKRLDLDAWRETC